MPPRRIEVPELSAGTVHLWEFDLDALGSRSGAGEGRALLPEVSALSGDERERAARFKFEIHRERYLTGRLVLRGILAAYLGIPAEKVAFQYLPAGKPFLAGSDPAFNLAHSNSRALLGITRDAEIGVDIEEIHPMEDMRVVAEFSFAEEEFRRWDRIPESDPDRVAAFYRCWTRKEAFLKATGEGIAHRLKSFTVAFEKETAPALLTGAEANWTLLDASSLHHTVAAVASSKPIHELKRISLLEG